MKKFTVHTDGKGHWSKVAKEVTITKIELDPEFDGVDVYFDRKTWNTSKDGLIYSDRLFEKELIAHLLADPEMKDKADWANLHYTEQGMQGRYHVSMEIWPALN